MTPLIDGDILLHELGWSGEFKDKETGEAVILDFEQIGNLLDSKIKLICQEVDATDPPIIFITNSEWLQSHKNRLQSTIPKYFPTFRYALAKTKPYKGTRNNPKPFHFYNVIIHLDTNYNVVVSEDGYEADDMMTIFQYEDMLHGKHQTVICSRDKDLRICPGWHYSWECGAQRSIGPHLTDDFGSLQVVRGKVIGYGLIFFYYQMLVGDSADNIPGCTGMGEKRSYALLENCQTEREAFKLVKQTYLDVFGKDVAKDYFKEQASLLWMIREKGVGYALPNY